MALAPQADALIRLSLMMGLVFSVVLMMIYMERKVLGHIQQRLGPMRTGFHGILQSPADAIKLLVKEDVVPTSADRWVFLMAPFLVFVPTFMLFVTIPFTGELVIRNLDMGIFYLAAFSSLHIVGMLMAGWGSDNKYALLGGARAAAQLVSYELPLIFGLLGVALLAGTLNLQEIVSQQGLLPFFVAQPLGLLIFFVSSLAETSRTPFDIPIAESELVGGPLVEYSGMRWSVFMLSEYASLFATAALVTVVYFGGWSWPFLQSGDIGGSWLERLLGVAWFSAKTFVIIFIVFWLRGTLPRLRIDQLMGFAWKILIPFSFLNLFITATAVMFGGWILLTGWLATFGFAYVVYNMMRRAP